jgi:hypothetical protein
LQVVQQMCLKLEKHQYSFVIVLQNLKLNVQLYMLLP